MENSNTYKIKKLTALAMLTALAYAVHFVHIPVMFLNLDFKDVIMTVGGMYFGPLAGVSLAVTVPVLEFFISDGTGVYGLVMNLCSSIVFVGTASLIYKYKKTIMGAIIGLVAAAFAMVAVMISANLLITPYYMGVTVAEVGALIPKLLLPFNAVKAVLNASLTLCVYKPITTVLRRTGFGKQVSATENSGQGANKKYSVLVWTVGGCIAILSLCVIFFVLGGRITFS